MLKKYRNRKFWKLPEFQWIFIDGSHVRAHQHSSGIKDQDIS